MNKIKRIMLIKRLGYIFYNLVILALSYVFNRFFQMLLFILIFNYIQNCFLYRFHADTIISNPIKAVKYCKIITITVEIIYLCVCYPLNIMVYNNLFIIFIIALLNALLEFYLRKTIISANILKNKELLLQSCRDSNISLNSTKRLVLHYIENKSYQEIANIECLELETIKQSIRRSKRKLGL